MPKLLIVDDEKSMSEFGKPFFERRGFTVFSASTGSEGLELFHREAPDAVLLDLGLPDMDGKDLLKNFKSTNKNAKIIVLTGFSESEIKEKVVPLNPDAYFTKPCRFPAMVEKIQELLKT